jgi:hypothetical protein
VVETAIPLMKSRRRIACPKAQDHANSVADYSRDITTGGMGFRDQFAQQQSETAHVGFGSKADIVGQRLWSSI